MRILIAEDDPKLLKSLVHIFQLNNYAVDGVDNGLDAFDLYDVSKGSITEACLSAY